MASSWIVEEVIERPAPKPAPADDAPDFERDLRPKDVKLNPDGLSDAELLEKLKDPRWRLRNLYYILDKDGHETKFVPNAVQEQFFDDIWFRNVVPKARQRGFTTAVCILALDYAVFNDNFAGALINIDMPTALRVFREKIKFAYDRLPALIRQMTRIVTNNKTELIFSNNSSLYVSVSTRGGTLQFLHVSELGQISKKHPEKATEIQTGSLPAVDQNGIIVIESTVEGAAGIFSDMVRRAQSHQQLVKAGTVRLSKMQYRLHWASWWDAKEYEADPEGVVISKEDNAYFHRMEAAIGRAISPRKRAWYVLKRDEEFNGDWEKMKSQYPTTIEESMEVSQDGLWLGRQMAMMRSQGRICPLPHDPSKPVHFFWDIGRSDNNAVWCGQTDGPWMNWLAFHETSGEPYAVIINEMRSAHPTWTWGQSWLPHDGEQRQYGTTVLKNSVDLLGELGVPNVDTVPRTLDLVDGGIEDLRAAMSMYRIDPVGCAEGILHLDGYAKVWNDTMSLWSSIVAKNGHQHGVDALRQHAQIRHTFLVGGRTKRTGRSRHSANAT